MDVSSIQAHFDSSPAIRLLRAVHAPWVVAFLHLQFKQREQATVRHSEMLAALRSWQEDIHRGNPDVLTDRAESYLSDWAAGERGWLYRLLESDSDEPTYQLTPHSERALDFVQQLIESDAGFIGTESRLRIVIETLQRVAVGASSDPEVHLEDLRRKKEQIERRIEQIEQDQAAPSLHPVRLREQFGVAVGLLRELTRDFRAVEDRFREIARTVQRQQLSGEKSRGGILAEALDAEDALRKDDQGVSFYEFFRLVQSTAQQDELRTIIAELKEIRELSHEQEGLQSVHRMMPVLLSEAVRVTQTERRLTTTLRRLLEQRSQPERASTAKLLQDIKGLAAQLAAAPPLNAVSVEVDAGITLYSPLSRRFWLKHEDFETVDLTDQTAATPERVQLFEQFTRLNRIDFGKMREDIHRAARDTGAVTLPELLEKHPPRSGVMDVLGYLQIASDDGHLIDQGLPEEVMIPGSSDSRSVLVVTVPRVVFVAEEAGLP